MSAFDDIFHVADRAKSALFAELPAQPKPAAGKKAKAGLTQAASGAGGSDAQRAQTAKPAKSSKAEKRKQQDQTATTPVKAAKKHKASRPPVAPEAAPAAAPPPAAAPQRQRAIPQKHAKAAAGPAGDESAAAKAAKAAAAALLKRQQAGGGDSDAEAPPPLHETVQKAQRQHRQQRAKAKKQKRQQQAAAAQTAAQQAAAQQLATPAERNAAAGGAAAAEQPLETAADGVEQAQGHSNEDNLDRTVFVGNLRATMKPKAIKQLFARYGKVVSVRLRSVPVKLDAAMPRRAAVLTGKVDAERATAHAYIVFSVPEEARAALAHNMQVVDGLHLRVDMATGAAGTAEAKSYSRGRSIFVGNLGFAAQDEDLVRLFSDAALDPELANAVTAVRVVRDRKTNIGKGIAFVEFKTKAAAASAMRLSEPKLNGRPLRISFLKQPKAGASAAAAAAAEDAKPGQKAGSQSARARIQKRDAAGGGKKAAAQPWMGVKTKGPLKVSAKPNGPAQTAAKQPKRPGAKAKVAAKPKRAAG